MGILRKIKENVVKKSVAKRKANNTFDDLLSESYALADNAGDDQNNSYYFSAHSADGKSLFARLGIRGCGLREVWFAYRDEQGNAFVNSKCEFNATDCPLTVKCVTPLKVWEVAFSGKVRQAKPDANRVMQTFGNDLQASFKGEFLCTEKLYEFSRDGDELPFARAVASEKWSKEFFAELNKNTQVHTEQSGRLTGTLVVGDKSFTVDSPAMRDHSFGRRIWGYMNRHIWLMTVSDSFNLNVNMVSYPALRKLRTGYFISDGKVANIVDSTEIEKMPCENAPSKFEYFCKLKDGRLLENKCELACAFKFEMGNGSYTIFEGIADYIVDGKKARGIAEFGYNSDITRWKK